VEKHRLQQFGYCHSQRCFVSTRFDFSFQFFICFFGPHIQNQIKSNPQALPTIKEPKERCQKIANYFLNRKDAHILCFQEAWFTQSRKELMNILIHSFPFIVDVGQVGMITFQTNGLLIASKLPVLRSRFFEFGNCIGSLLIIVVGGTLSNFVNLLKARIIWPERVF